MVKISPKYFYKVKFNILLSIKPIEKIIKRCYTDGRFLNKKDNKTILIIKN